MLIKSKKRLVLSLTNLFSQNQWAHPTNNQTLLVLQVWSTRARGWHSTCPSFFRKTSTAATRPTPSRSQSKSWTRAKCLLWILIRRFRIASLKAARKPNSQLLTPRLAEEKNLKTKQIRRASTAKLKLSSNLWGRESCTSCQSRHQKGTSHLPRRSPSAKSPREKHLLRKIMFHSHPCLKSASKCSSKRRWRWMR